MFIVCAHMLSLFSSVRLFVTPTVACQAPLSVGFSRQEYWGRLPFPTPGDLPDPGIKSKCLASPALAGRFFTTAAAVGESLQSCLSLCDPRESIPPGSPVPGIFQARTLEWVDISLPLAAAIKNSMEEKKKKQYGGNSLAVQWLGYFAFTAKGTGSIPGQGTKITTPQKIIIIIR